MKISTKIRVWRLIINAIMFIGSICCMYKYNWIIYCITTAISLQTFLRLWKSSKIKRKIEFKIMLFIMRYSYRVVDVVTKGRHDDKRLYNQEINEYLRDESY